MPYQVKWFIENEVVLLIYTGDQSVEDLRGSLLEAGVLVKGSPRETVHTISDITKVTYSLKMQDSMRVIREIPSSQKDGWQVTVGKLDVVTKMGLAVSKSILRSKITSVDTMDEAIAHLKEVDTELRWHKARMNLLEE